MGEQSVLLSRFGRTPSVGSLVGGDDQRRTPLESIRLVLSCDGCTVGPGPRCDDCLVTAVLGDRPAVLDHSTLRAVEALQSGRVLPPLRRAVFS